MGTVGLIINGLMLLILVTLSGLFVIWGIPFFRKLLSLQVNILYYTSLQLAALDKMVKDVSGFKATLEGLETKICVLKQSVNKRPPS